MVQQRSFRGIGAAVIQPVGSGVDDPAVVQVMLVDQAGATGGDVSVKPGSTETKITAATMPAGGVGFIGWLSAIWYALAGIASGSTDSGNPVKVGGVSNTALPTLTNGQRVDLQTTTKGQLLVTSGAAAGVAAVDGSNNSLLSLERSGSTNTDVLFKGVFPFRYNGATWDRERKRNGVSRIASAAATTNATVAKASAGDAGMITGINAAASKKYLKVYNKATAPTVGTDVPVFTFELPATSGFVFDMKGQYFSAGIAYALTGAPGDGDTTALAAADVLALSLTYA